MGKEKLAFAITVLLLGLLVFFSFQEEPATKIRPNEKGIEIPKIIVPDLDRLVLPANTKSLQRDFFAAPRDTEALPPLALDIPPAPKLSALAVPMKPTAGMVQWSHFYRCDGQITPFEFPVAEAEEAAQAPAPVKESTKEDSKKTENSEAYKKLYDWIRPTPFALVYGRIQNPNPFELGYPKLRDGESLLLQEMDPLTGKLKGKPTNWQGDRVLEYGFADTILNQIEIRKRKTAFSAANLEEVLALADWCLRKAGEEPRAFNQAATIYQRAAELDPANPAGVLGLGRLYEHSFELEKAYELYKGMSESKFSHRAEPWTHLGALQAKLRMFDLAEVSLRSALDRDGANGDAKVELAQFLLDRERGVEAFSLLSASRVEASAKSSDRSEVRRLLAESALYAGKLDEAISSFQQALQVDTNSDDAALGLASSYYAKGDFRQALSKLDAALTQGKVSPELYIGRGLCNLQLKQFAQAERDFQSALGLDPLKDYYAYSALAFLYRQTGHPERAFQAIEAGYLAEPTDPYLRFERAQMLLEREDLEGALEEVESLLDRESRFPDGLILRGRVASFQGEYEDADRYFSFACELDAKNAALLSLRALNLLKAGQIRRSVEIFRKALAIDSEQPTALCGLAYCAYAEGNNDEAIRAFAELIDRHREADEYLEYGKKSFAAIQDHLSKLLWVDNFERNELFREWKEEAKVGPEIRLDSGQVQMRGMAREAGRTRLYQEITAKNFLSVELGLQSETNNQSLVGLQLVSEKKIGDSTRVDFEVDIARLRNGKLGTRVQIGQADAEWKIHEGISWPPAQAVKLAIERVDRGEETALRLRFQGQSLGELIKFPRLKSAAGEVRLGLFAETEAGRELSVSGDDFRMVYRAK